MNTQHHTKIVGSCTFSLKHANFVILTTCPLILPAEESTADTVPSSCCLFTQIF